MIFSSPDFFFLFGEHTYTSEALFPRQRTIPPLNTQAFQLPQAKVSHKQPGPKKKKSKPIITATRESKNQTGNADTNNSSNNRLIKSAFQSRKRRHSNAVLYLLHPPLDYSLDCFCLVLFWVDDSSMEKQSPSAPHLTGNTPTAATTAFSDSLLCSSCSTAQLQSWFAVLFLGDETKSRQSSPKSRACGCCCLLACQPSRQTG